MVSMAQARGPHRRGGGRPNLYAFVKRKAQQVGGVFKIIKRAFLELFITRYDMLEVLALA